MLTGDSIVISTKISALLCLPLAGAYLLASIMRKDHAHFIHALWLGFSISLIATFPLAFLAEQSGWISKTGTVIGDGGERVAATIEFMLGIGEEFALFVGALFVIVASQVLSYLFTAPLGCATGVGMVSRSLGIGTLFILKGLISGAGFILGVVANSFIYHWPLGTTPELIKIVMVALSMVMVSFSMLYSYVEVPHMFSRGKRRLMFAWPRFHRKLACIHRWATRHQKHGTRTKIGDDLAGIASSLKRITQRSVAERVAFHAALEEYIDLSQRQTDVDRLKELEQKLRDY